MGLLLPEETPVSSQVGLILNIIDLETHAPVFTLEHSRFSCSAGIGQADFHVEDLAFAFQEESFVRAVVNNANN